MNAEYAPNDGNVIDEPDDVSRHGNEHGTPIVIGDTPGGARLDAREATQIIGSGRPVVLIGVGTSGRMIAVHFKAWLWRVFGRVPDNVRILVFDLDPRTLSVRIDETGEGETITLERDIQDHRIAPGTTFGRLMQAAQRDPGSHPELAALRQLVKDGFRDINFETGAGGERLAGNAAWTSWAANIRRLLANAFTEIARLHRPGEDDTDSGRSAMTVFVVGGLAGGTGAATLLPAIREALETMDSVGVDVDASFVIEVAILPEAFPQTTHRLATTAATLKDHDVALLSGRLPGATETTPLSRKPDLALLAGAATETGHTLVEIREVADVVGLACVILSLYPMRDAGVAALSNIGRRMRRRTPSGSPMSWGSVGSYAYVFPAEEIARYYAHHAAAEAVGYLLRPAPPAGPDIGAVFEMCRVPDVEALMQNAQLDEDGQPLVGDLAGEVGNAMRTYKGRPAQKLHRLAAIEGAAMARANGAAVVATANIAAVTKRLATLLEQRAHDVEEADGIPAGLAAARSSSDRVAAFVGSLERDRGAFKERLSAEEERRVDLSEQLDALVRRGWRAGRRLDRAVNDYLQASGSAINVGLALQLTDAAIGSLAEVGMGLDVVASNMLRRDGLLRASRADLQRGVERFEASRPSSVAERHLYQGDELRRLFAEHHDAPWDGLSEDMRRRIVQRLGPPKRWRADAGSVTDALLRAGETEASWSTELSADDFLSWVLPLRGVARDTFIRDSFEQAALLWRYDAARMPEDAGFEDTTFDLAGVPDIEHSALRGTTRAQLVATGDRHRLLFLRLKVGLPWVALWRAGIYEAAYKKVATQDEVTLHVYPDYPPHRKGRR